LNEKGAKLNVIEVKFDRETGIVHHIGEFENEKYFYFTKKYWTKLKLKSIEDLK